MLFAVLACTCYFCCMFDYFRRANENAKSIREKTESSCSSPPSSSTSEERQPQRQPQQQAEPPPRRLPRACSPIVLVQQLFTLAAIVFLILVLVGNTRNTPALTKIYFLSIDVSHVSGGRFTESQAMLTDRR